MQIIDWLLVYILRIFYWEEPQEIQYEKNKEFNNMLDEENPIAWISYSLALFEQDLPSYMSLYDEYEAVDSSNT